MEQSITTCHHCTVSLYLLLLFEDTLLVSVIQNIYVVPAK